MLVLLVSLQVLELELGLCLLLLSDLCLSLEQSLGLLLIDVDVILSFGVVVVELHLFFLDIKSKFLLLDSEVVSSLGFLLVDFNSGLHSLRLGLSDTQVDLILMELTLFVSITLGSVQLGVSG